MRGSGKTTVGMLLAKKINFRFAQCDEILEKKAEATISEFVAKFGWPKFRILESEIISKICQKDNTVISTGGGVVEKQGNIDHLKKNGIIIYFKADVDTLYARIANSKNRPLLTGAKSMLIDLKNVLNKREPLYNKNANLIINVSSKKIEEIIDIIISYLKDKKYI